jgi:predicted RNA-binding protein with PIN domain
MDGARMKLIESLSNYQAIRNCRIIAVFDAYRVQGHREEVMDYHNIHLVFTKDQEFLFHILTPYFLSLHKHCIVRAGAFYC